MPVSRLGKRKKTRNKPRVVWVGLLAGLVGLRLCSAQQKKKRKQWSVWCVAVGLIQAQRACFGYRVGVQKY